MPSLPPRTPKPPRVSSYSTTRAFIRPRQHNNTAAWAKSENKEAAVIYFWKALFFFFSERIIWAVERGNPFFACINFPPPVCPCHAPTCPPWKIHLFPRRVAIQDCRRSTCGFTTTVCLTGLAASTLSVEVWRCIPPPHPPRSLPVLLTIEMSPWQLE